MGVNFFIIPLENIDPEYQPVSESFHFNLDEFTKALKEKWRNAEIRIDDSNDSHITWECEINHKHKLRGSSSRDDYGVALEKPDVNDVEEFAIWYRTLIPAEVRLVILKDSDVEHYREITSDTTYIQLIDFFTDYDYWITVTLANNEPIDIDNLPSQLRAQWSEVEIFPMIDADPLAFYWERKLEHEFTGHYNLTETLFVTKKLTQDITVDGAVSKDRSEMYLGPFPYSELAKTLMWYRSIVDESTELFGALPEFDSLAVAGLLTELEERLGILIEDHEVDADMMETFGALLNFARNKALT